jgi:starch-binding outer membrane protein, SusD/RagB family
MTKGMNHRLRLAMRAGAGALGLLAVGGCSIQDSLLEQQQPQVILPEQLASPTGALGAYTGVMSRVRTSLNGGDNNTESIWNFAGLMSDEMRASDTFSQRIDADSRNTQTFDAVLTTLYNKLQQTRGYSRDAISLLSTYAPTEKAKIGEVYYVMGFMELTLGQDFCNGIPLGETVNALPVYTDPLTNAQVFQQAIARFDTTLATVTGTDNVSVQIRNAALVAKGRAQVNLEQYAAAAATVASVPTSFSYLITYSQTTQRNEWERMFADTKRYTVGMATDAVNALPFATANDPRVKVLVTTGNGFDNTSKYNELQNWGKEDPISMVNGLDARLIEAEAQLQQKNVAGWTAMNATLNALRAAPPVYGNFKITPDTARVALTPLPVPLTQIEAENQFFTEKAYWQYGRGERLNDMRRLVRQYKRAVNAVYPTGTYPKGGPYGNNTAFPVPDAEKTNPKFTGCLNTDA